MASLAAWSQFWAALPGERLRAAVAPLIGGADATPLHSLDDEAAFVDAVHAACTSAAPEWASALAVFGAHARHVGAAIALLNASDDRNGDALKEAVCVAGAWVARLPTTTSNNNNDDDDDDVEEEEGSVPALRAVMADCIRAAVARREPTTAAQPGVLHDDALASLRAVCVQAARKADGRLGALLEEEAGKPGTTLPSALASCRATLTRQAASGGMAPSTEVCTAIRLLSLGWPDAATRRVLSASAACFDEAVADAAVAELARQWPDATTRVLLQPIAASGSAGANAAVAALGRLWPDAETRTLLTNLLCSGNFRGADAAADELARLWPDDATCTLLAERIRSGQPGASGAARQLVRIRPDDATRALLADAVRGGLDGAAQDLVRVWPDATTRTLLEELAEQGGSTAQQAVHELVRLWPDDAMHAFLLRLAADGQHFASRAVVSELVRLWPNDATTRTALSEVALAQSNGATLAATELCRLWPDAARPVLTRIVDEMGSAHVFAMNELCRRWPDDAATRALIVKAAMSSHPMASEAVLALAAHWKDDDAARTAVADVARTGTQGAHAAVYELCRTWPGDATNAVLASVIWAGRPYGTRTAISQLCQLHREGAADARPVLTQAIERGIAASGNDAVSALAELFPDTATKDLLLDVAITEGHPLASAALAQLRKRWPQSATASARAAAKRARAAVPDPAAVTAAAAASVPATPERVRCTCGPIPLGGFEQAADTYGVEEDGASDFFGTIVSSRARRYACGRLRANDDPADPSRAHVAGEVAACAAAANAAVAALSGTYVMHGDESDHTWFAFSAPRIDGEAPLAAASDGAAVPVPSEALHRACGEALDPALDFAVWPLDAEIERLAADQPSEDSAVAWRAASEALTRAGLVRLTYLRPNELAGRGVTVYPHFILGVTAHGSVAGVAGLTVWT